MNENNKLSRNIRQICQKQNMQLKDLAEKMGIAPESLSRAINGNPQLSTLTTIADHLDVPISALFDGVNTDSTVRGILTFGDKAYHIVGVRSLMVTAKEIAQNSAHSFGFALKDGYTVDWIVNGKVAK